MTLTRHIRSLIPRVILITWVPWVSAGGRAESNPQPQVVPGAEATSILAAKRDLEAIKAVKEAQSAPVLNGPSQRLAVPELRTEPAAVPPPALRVVKPEAKSDNWLIDAMAQSERDRREGRVRQRLTEANRGSSRTATDREIGSRGAAFGSNAGVGRNAIDPMAPRDRIDSRGARGEAAAERNGSSALSTSDETKTPVTLNPLTHFLGDWMTPQDYALLRPGLETGSPGGVVRPGEARFSLPGTPDFALESSLKREIPGGFAVTTPIPSELTPRTNPFLESMSRIEFTPPARVNPPPVQPDPGLLPSAAAPASPPPASAAVVAPLRPNVPDFPKPLQDEKYFKQLKRF